MTAGRVCGDLVFPIPYCPELHFSEFNSAVADMKNSVAVSPSIYSNSVLCIQCLFIIRIVTMPNPLVLDCS